MNPRIKELAEQAYNEQNPELLTNASRTFEHGVWLEGYSKKFAELIVRECVLISRTSTDGFSAGRRMLEQFGIEP